MLLVRVSNICLGREGLTIVGNNRSILIDFGIALNKVPLNPGSKALFIVACQELTVCVMQFLYLELSLLVLNRRDMLIWKAVGISYDQLSTIAVSHFGDKITSVLTMMFIIFTYSVSNNYYYYRH